MASIFRQGRCCCAAALLLARPPSSWRVLAVACPPAPPAAAVALTTRGAAASASAAAAGSTAAGRHRAQAARATAASLPSTPRPSTSAKAAHAAKTPPSPSSPLPPTLDLRLPPASNAKVRTAVYRGSAVRLDGCPPEDAKRPEVAVIGRSNVGKSSLVNALTGSKGLAMVSKSPGKTRTINHFLINDSWWLVDLPGYGYAKTAKTTREAFDAFSRDFLSRRRSLAMVLLLVDASVPPQRVDLEYAGWLATSGVPFAVVFTKTDKRPKKGGAAAAAAAAGAKAAAAAAAARAGSAAAGAADAKEEQEEHAEQHEDEVQEEDEEEEATEAGSEAAVAPAEGAAAAAVPAPPRPAAAAPRAASASPHALAFLRALADDQGFRLLPPSMATSASTGAGTAEVLRFVSSVRLGFLQRRKEAKAEAQRLGAEADGLRQAGRGPGAQEEGEEQEAAAAAAAMPTRGQT